jgi:DNA-binding MarR family transcriptional regulator
MRAPATTRKHRSSAAPSMASVTERSSGERVAGCTCFLVRRLARRVTQHYDRALAPSGLRVTQFSLLSQLLYQGALAMGPLADALDMDRTTLTRNLRPLIAGGLVALSSDVDDARVRIVTATAAGRRRAALAKKLWRRAQDEVNRTCGEPRVASLHRVFGDLIATFNQTLENRPPSKALA